MLNVPWMKITNLEASSQSILVHKSRIVNIPFSYTSSLPLFTRLTSPPPPATPSQWIVQVLVSNATSSSHKRWSQMLSLVLRLSLQIHSADSPQSYCCQYPSFFQLSTLLACPFATIDFVSYFCENQTGSLLPQNRRSSCYWIDWNETPQNTSLAIFATCSIGMMELKGLDWVGCATKEIIDYRVWTSGLRHRISW